MGRAGKGGEANAAHIIVKSPVAREYIALEREPLKRPDPLEDLQDLINSLWRKTGLGGCVTVSPTRSDDGSPHIERHGDKYDIVISERGSERKRIPGLSLPVAARWFVFGMAARHSQSSELRDRRTLGDAPLLAGGLKDDGYSRWNWMAPTIALMRQISPTFGDWAAQEYAQTLLEYPLSESETRNARYPFSADSQ